MEEKIRKKLIINSLKKLLKNSTSDFRLLTSKKQGGKNELVFR